MANFVNYISGKLRPYTIYITITFIIIVFILVSIFLFTRFNKDNSKNIKDFEDVANKSGRNEEIEIMLFHVNWCPHCIKALPDWQAFCDQYNNQLVNNYVIRCNRNGNDCTNDSDSNVKSLISDYGIDSYPTIVLMKGDKRYDFDAKITKNALDQFLESVTTD